ncbi:MAG TPA: hypothetical protein VF342_10295 [Alphaproteobacteria bacterium]
MPIAYLAHRLDTIDLALKPDVHEDQVGLEFMRQSDRPCGAGCDADGFAARLLDHVRKVERKNAVVFDDQHPNRFARSPGHQSAAVGQVAVVARLRTWEHACRWQLAPDGARNRPGLR